jgi:preprotein translocase subunit SecD
MKHLVAIAPLIAAVLIVACVGPKTVEKNGGLIIEVRFADRDAAVNTKKLAAEVIFDRMDAAFVRNPVVELTADGGGLHIELPRQEDTMLFKELATKPGRFEIVECYDPRDILPVLYEIDSRMTAMPKYAGTEYPLFQRYIHHATEPYFNGVAGYVPTAEMAGFEAVMDSAWVKALFPRGARPALIKPKDDMSALVVLKYPADGRAPVRSEMVEQASVSKNEWQEGSYVVNFRFAEPFHETWARLTRENIGRCLAIVVDGMVYSAPQVNDEIVGGRCQITSDFTLEEAGAIAAILNGSELPTPLEIVSAEIINK